MRTILCFGYLIFALIGYIPAMLKCKRLERRGMDEEMHRTADKCIKNFARGALKVAGVTVDIYGEENIGSVPAVYVPNHQGNWDVAVLLAYLDKPYGFISKDSISKIPLVRTWMSFMNCVFIDRSNTREAVRAVSNAASRITQGDSIIIFPEGTRSRGENMGEFKLGAFKSAIKYDVPIIPVSIDGTYRIMEANKGSRIHSAHVILTFLPPVCTSDYDREEQKTLPAKVSRMILDARYESRMKLKKTLTDAGKSTETLTDAGEANDTFSTDTNQND